MAADNMIVYFTQA